MASKNVKFKCPYCEIKAERADLVTHIDEVHPEVITDEYTALRIVFNYVNKKPFNYNGKCTECGGPTKWDENKGRYDRQCSNPKCKKSYLEKFEKNMKDKLGVTRISSTAEGQNKMLNNRKISGKYKFQDGEEKTYVGKYEKATLEFMDKVMNCKSSDVITPGPIFKYKYKGEDHIYISDMYYQPYDLIIEVKDGGDKPNGRDMKEYREKQIEKENYIIKNTNYNYIRLTNNDLSQLLAVFMDLKMQLVDESNDRVIHINESSNYDKYSYIDESMNALMSGYMPGYNSAGSTYIVNYMQNNVFGGTKDYNYGITNDPQVKSIITRDEEGRLVNKEFNKDDVDEYNIYLTNKSSKEVSESLYPFMNEIVNEGFIYEKVFGKKMYSYDQIEIEENAIKIPRFEDTLYILGEVMKNLLQDKYNQVLLPLNNDYDTILYKDVFNDSYLYGSYKYPYLCIESNNIDMDKFKVFKLLLAGGKQ